jgi:valyl-tRNA synthetase
VSRNGPIDKVFDPRRFEERWYDEWQRLGVFTARPDSGRPPFVMVIPPPNVTGRLHMGTPSTTPCRTSSPAGAA